MKEAYPRFMETGLRDYNNKVHVVIYRQGKGYPKWKVIHMDINPGLNLIPYKCLWSFSVTVEYAFNRC